MPALSMRCKPIEYCEERGAAGCMGEGHAIPCAPSVWRTECHGELLQTLLSITTCSAGDGSSPQELGPTAAGVASLPPNSTVPFTFKAPTPYFKRLELECCKAGKGWQQESGVAGAWACHQHPKVLLIHPWASQLPPAPAHRTHLRSATAGARRPGALGACAW